MCSVLLTSVDMLRLSAADAWLRRVTYLSWDALAPIEFPMYIAPATAFTLGSLPSALVKIDVAVRASCSDRLFASDIAAMVACWLFSSACWAGSSSAASRT